MAKSKTSALRTKLAHRCAINQSKSTPRIRNLNSRIIPTVPRTPIRSRIRQLRDNYLQRALELNIRESTLGRRAQDLRNDSFIIKFDPDFDRDSHHVLTNRGLT